MKNISYILVSVLLFGCGFNDKASNDQAVSWKAPPPEPTKPGFAMAVPTDADLPTCNQANKYILVYVTASKAFKSCNGTEWSAIDIKGDKGDQGESGVGMKIKSSVWCSTTVDQTSRTHISYQLVTFATNDVMVTGTVAGNDHEVSQSVMYASTQNGAQNGSVAILFDSYGSQDSGYWELTYDKSTSVLTIVYNDGDIPGTHAITWTSSSGQCSVNNY